LNNIRQPPHHAPLLPAPLLNGMDTRFHR
jgi:hypothetical protein